jgi:hypothetical protein
MRLFFSSVDATGRGIRLCPLPERKRSPGVADTIGLIDKRAQYRGRFDCDLLRRAFLFDAAGAAQQRRPRKWRELKRITRA